MSNVLKSYNVCLNPDSRFTLQKRVQCIIGRDTSDISIQTTKPIEHVIEKAKQDAEAIRHKAQEEANEIIARATREAQRIKEEARETGFGEGFQAGFQKGLESAQKQFVSEMDELQRIKQEIAKEKEGLYNKLEQELVVLALDIAKLAIYDRLEVDDEALAQVVESTLKKIQGKVKAQLKVSTQDYDRISQLKECFLSKLSYLEDINIMEDAFLSPGSCVVDTGRGIVEGSVDARLREIETALVGR